MFKKILYTLLLLAIVSCSQIQKATDAITQPTAREVYARGFEKDDSIYNSWNSAFAKAYQKKVLIQNQNVLSSLPYTTVGTYSSTYLIPYRYTFTLAAGEIFHAEVENNVDSTAIFLDLFTWKNDSIMNSTPRLSNAPNERKITTEITASGLYTLLVQPQIGASSSFALKIYTKPQYSFPVLGKGNKAVQSFWGASRSGGKRSHEGVDIFAARGTPVVAITDGMISSTGNRGLGGKQVWLRDGIFGQSLYYAHLDSIIATTGQRVKIGDTLGLVGNTGNARTTPPHLHFGIYNRTGAINPYPYIKQTESPLISDSLSSNLGLLKNNSTMRVSPTSTSEKIGTLKRKDTVLLLEKTGNWFHVRVHDSLQGYLYKTAIKPIPYT
ncbi:peptidoglycan DD-metalloendopeptidase family protein [Dokdonia sp. R78006]|uniref:peptidoglycan DD-metalloendopeptidase family protein n=1 Tax=Dokdonia sp. R78006 TaxID=3093866 RepID=UPI0036D3CBD0